MSINHADLRVLVDEYVTNPYIPEIVNLIYLTRLSSEGKIPLKEIDYIISRYEVAKIRVSPECKARLIHQAAKRVRQSLGINVSHNVLHVIDTVDTMNSWSTSNLEDAANGLNCSIRDVAQYITRGGEYLFLGRYRITHPAMQ